MADKEEIRKKILTLRNGMTPEEVPRAARIGAAFSCQIVAEIPADSHDIPADRIVTEQEIIIPDRGASGSMYAAAFPKAGG